jgi:hypothetical protein
MSASVTVLPQPKIEQAEGVVRVLEEWLVEAQSGHLRAVAIAGVFVDESVQTEIKTVCGYSHQLVAAVTSLFWELGALWLKRDE